MRRTGALLATLGALAWAGCATPDPIVTTAQVRLRLPSDTECRPTWSRLVVQALGDFPASEQLTDGFVPADMMAFGNDRFPWDTQALTVRGFAAGEVAGGTLTLGGRDVEGDVLLLPYGRPCGLGDPSAAAPDGTAAVALPDGGLMIVGGGDGTRIARLAQGSELFDTTASLFNPRYRASATVAAGSVIIAGGGFGETGPVQQNYEIYDLETRTLGAGGALCDRRGRRDHGSVSLPDGTVLLVGGVDTDGVPRADAELLDPRSGCVARVDGLPQGRRDPTVLALDDGTVLVIGGTSAGGRYEKEPVAYNAFNRELVSAGDLQFPRYQDAALVALPGGRVAALGGLSVPSTGPGRTPVSSVSVLLPDATIADLGPLVTPALWNVRAVPLADGTVLVTGSVDEAGAEPRALVIDVGRGSTREVGATTRVPTALVVLADGTVAGLDEVGVSLRREQLLTRFDNPPSTLLQGDTLGVAVDAYPRWESSTGRVTALRSEARIDLPTLRFARFAAELDAEGGAAILIQRENSYAEVVPLFQTTAGPALCDVERVASAPLRVERDGDTLRISAGGATRACRVNALGERVGLAVTASPGTEIRALRVARLGDGL